MDSARPKHANTDTADITAPRITMLGKPACHLCDEALRTIERVAGELGVSYEVRDINEASLTEKEEYWEKIPVTFVDGHQHDFWQVSEKRLRAALDTLSRRWRMPWSRR